MSRKNFSIVSALNRNAEFSGEAHLEGTCSMARAADPNSADSQFFLMLAPSPHLDSQYSIWGQITEGMEHVHAIKKGDGMMNGSVNDPDKIISMKVAADA